ncbi:MAG: putative PEP-binding protein [Solirubrobacterales bacterium]
MARRSLDGAPASPGVASGAARWLGLPPAASAAPVEPADRPRERERAIDALDRAAAEIVALAARLREDRREDEARLVETGALMAEDRLFRDAVVEAIDARGLAAPAAIEEAAASAAAAIASLPDATLAARADDVRSVARRAAALASGEDAGYPRADFEGAILLAVELGPADVLELGTAVNGIALSAGGVTTHAAIVARSIGIPMVVGVGGGLEGVPDGEQLVVDGDAAAVVREPTTEELDAGLRAVDDRRRARTQAAATSGLPSVTTDGRTVRVLVNAAGPEEVGIGLEAGADGMGLLRTELAHLESTHWPTETEHRAALEPTLAALGPEQTATVRILDLGGDKLAPFVAGERRRGIALMLAQPEALDSQLRAILTCGREVDLRVLIPMVRGVDDVRAVGAALSRAVDAVPHSRTPALGAMIETREAAVLAQRIAREVDFLSVGTNDLSASVLGTDRSAASAVAVHDPELLRLLAQVARAGARMGIPVEVCGEMASDPLMVPLLVGMGVNELSVGAARVGLVRSWIRALSYLDCLALARTALASRSAAQINSMVEPVAAGLGLLGQSGDAVGERSNGAGGFVTLGAQR